MCLANGLGYNIKSEQILILFLFLNRILSLGMVYTQKRWLAMANTSITKRAIQSAFLELLDQRSLSRITVKDITDICGINRNTFYYYFEDLPKNMLFEIADSLQAGEYERIKNEKRLTDGSTQEKDKG